jgi:hypothetical protein
MKIVIALIVSSSFFLLTDGFAQKCDSLKVEVTIKHTSGTDGGELTFKPASSGQWTTHLQGPTAEMSVTKSDKLTFNKLQSGYYDFFIVDRNKRFCLKHIRIKIN